MELARTEIERRLAVHYSERFGGKVGCMWDEEKAAYCIRGEGLTPHPSLMEMYPNGWSLLDFISPAKAAEVLDLRVIALDQQQIEALGNALDMAYSDQEHWLSFGNLKADYFEEDLPGKADTFRAIGRAGELLGFHGEADRWGALADHLLGESGDEEESEEEESDEEEADDAEV